VIVIGLIMLVVGYLIGLGLLITLGWIFLAVGLILLLLGGIGHPVAGRRYWF